MDLIGGFSAFVQKGMTPGERTLIDSLPEVLMQTRRVCASINVGTTRAGLNVDAVRLVAARILDAAQISRAQRGFACAKLVVFANMPEDNPFMAGAVLGPGEAERVATALNDVVVQRWQSGKMLDFETWIDDCFVNTHGGDGLVVATSTGSTAYALSCGGPIIDPKLSAVVLAPICPHTISDRPIVVPHDSRIEVRLVERIGVQAQVTCDGTVLGLMVDADARLCIEPAAETITLLHPPGYDYYRILRSKLHWGRGARHADPER